MHRPNDRRPSITTRLAGLLLLSCLAALPLGAQVAQERERGFKPELVYQFNGIDSVGLFNGNLNLTMPLMTYPVSSDVSYSFVLRYSGNLWRDIEICKQTPKNDNCRENWMGVGGNAGFGWSLSFGKIEGTKHRYDISEVVGFQYVSPDGGEHVFYETLHEPVCDSDTTTNCDPHVAGVWYTRDGTYLRLKEDGADAVIVEFPSGQRERHVRLPSTDPSRQWQLQYIYGTSSEMNGTTPTTNFVHFAYTEIAPSTGIYHWTITDSHQREHRVYFQDDMTRQIGGVVDRLELAAFQQPGETRSAAVAHYNLVYDTETGSQDAPEPSKIPKPYRTGITEVDMPVRLLRRFELPTGEAWRFRYHDPPTATEDPSSGVLLQAILPTGGSMGWTYQSYMFSSTKGEIPATGVNERCMRTDDQDVRCSIAETGAQVQYAKYLHDRGTKSDGTAANFNTTTIETYVRQGSGWGLDTKSVNYFVRTYGGQMGLPFNPDRSETGRFLSTETYECNPADGSCVKDRETWIAYDSDLVNDAWWCHIDFPCSRDRNRRVRTEKTVFVRDNAGVTATAETNRSNFDGLGHYRSTVNTGTFGGRNTIENFTNFNQSLGVFQIASGQRLNGYTMLPHIAAWILGTYTETKVKHPDELTGETGPDGKPLTMPGEGSYTEACFDASNGFLLKKRIKKHPRGGRDATDLLVVYDRDPETGYARSETSMGGDFGPTIDPAKAVCDVTATPNAYSFTTNYTFAFGALKTVRAGSMPFFSTDLDIDQNTGLASASRDTTGVMVTKWLYDRGGRLEKVSPPAIAATTYTYDVATDTALAKVTASTGTGDLETRQVWEFDRLARLSVEKRLMPSGTWSGRKTEYDSAGRKLAVSEQETISGANFNPIHKTIYADFDAQGRPGKVTAPDGKETTFAYTGDRLVSRTSTIAIEGSTNEVPVTVVEERDRHGRLISVTEDSTGAAYKTLYDYDASGRLLEVTVSGGSQPPRTFTYDGRGFMTEEFHPESQTTKYKYDARGNVIERETPAGTIVNSYDQAGRIKSVTSGGQELKVFAYDRSVSDYSMGKLDFALRNNYSTELGKVAVKERFFYEGPGGRLTTKETSVTYDSGETFTFATGFDYNQVGDLTTLLYPSCLSGSCATLTAPERAVVSTYEHGLVTDVDRYTVGITYHANGAIDEIRHADVDGSAGPVYKQTIANGLARPDSISVTGFCDDLSIGTHPAARTVSAGSPAGLTVVATGTSSYQWFRVVNGIATSVATTQNLDIAVTETSTFFVRVGNGTCTVDSRRATVTVGNCATPDATMTGPASITAGVNATASVPDTPGVTYAWTIQNGTIVSGADTREVTFRGDGCSGTVVLSVSVANSCSTTATATQNIVLSGPRAAVTGGGTIQPNGEATIQAFLTGAGPWVVTWSDGNVQSLPAGQNAAIRTVSPAVTTTYSVTSLVDGAGCSGTSTGAALVKVVEPPSDCGTADWNPAPYSYFTTIMPNHQASLSAGLKITGGNFTGTRMYHYRWFENGTLAQSIDTDQPTNGFITRFTGQTIIRLDAWVSCREGTVEKSKTPAITANSIGVQWDHCPTLPVAIEPKNVVLPANGSVPLTIDFAPFPDHAIQWYAGETGNTAYKLDFQTNATLTVTEPGTYWARVTTACGTINDSPTAVVSTQNGCAPVRINTDPQGETITAGQTVNLSVSATGTPLPTYYLWLTPPDQPVTGARSSTLTVNPIRTTDYAVRVGNDCSMTRSRWARIHVTACADVIIHQQPEDKSAVEGTPVSIGITATATGGAQLYYQWYEGESGDTTVSIPGVAGQGQTLDLGVPTASNKYWVRVSFNDPNKCAVDSRTVTVSVCSTPVIFNPVNDRNSQFPGQDQSFSVGASGENLKYAWYEGSNLNDETKLLSTTSALLIYPNVTTDYYVKVTSDCVAGQTDRVAKDAFKISVCPDFRDDETPVAGSTLVPSGGTTTLTVRVDRGDVVEWYKSVGGAPAVKFREGPNLTTVTTDPISENTTFFARARSGNCHKDSRNVTVNVCTSPRVQWNSGPTQIAKGVSFTLSTSLGAGETANFKWYIGTTAGDVANSTLVYSSSGTFNVSGIQQTTSYWVRATNDSTGCYSDTAVRTVTVCVPTITAQPQSIMIAPSSSTTLAVGTDDLAGVSYQWYIGQAGDTSNPVTTNGTGASLTVSPSATTTYWVQVKGCPSPNNPVAVNSEAATVTICKPPAITTDINPLILPRNYNLTLSVVAGGDGLRYQWYEGAAGDTSKPVGTDSPSYSFTTSVSKRFWVKVTGTCGTTNSAAPLISVEPAIATHPASRSVTKGTAHTLTVAAAAGSTELRYEWYQRSGGTITLMSGTTSSASFTTPAINADSTFFARVYSGQAKTDSSDAVLSLCVPSTVSINQPSDVAGSTVTLSVDSPATGETFQWYRGNSGDTSAPIGTGWYVSVAPTTTTNYWVRTTRSTCSADSATRTVNVCRPAITTQPASTTVTKGSSTTLSVAATGTGTLYYQWYTGTPGGANSAITGATAATYSAAPQSTTTYFARVTSSSTCGTRHSDSAVATVTVCTPPSITTDINPLVVPRNYNLTLSIAASGDGLQYQWYEGAAGDTSKPVGTNSPSYTFTTSVSKRFWVKVTGSCGSAVNSSAPLISVEPAIATHPAGGSVTKGTSRTLTVAAAAGSTELRYEWYQRTAGGITLMSGTTSSTSFTTPAINADSTFFARVYSGLAKTDSNDAVLTLCVPSTFSVTATTQVSGSANRLSIDSPVSGETYQWYRGSSGDTSSPVGSGSIFDVYPTESTYYWVRTTRASCSADSAARMVTVCRPKITTDPVSTRIANGTSTVLSVAATGTGPLYYEWYIGEPGGGASLIYGANQSTYTASPTTTTTYFARVTSSSTCSNRWTDSAAATVTVCNGPAIVHQDGAKAVTYGYNLTLQVSATGDDLQYQWYEGPVGNTSYPVGNGSYQFTFTTYRNTTYWVRITGSCGAPLDSAPMDIHVYPKITSQPQNAVACGVGGTANFSVTAQNGISYQWYRQVNNGAVEAVGTNSPNLSIAVSQTPVQFWVAINQGTYAVTTSNKVSATIAAVPTVTSFTSTQVTTTQWQIKATVASGDTSLVKYRFYQGQLGDTSQLLADSTLNYRTVNPTATSRTYWVRVYYYNTTSQCYTDRVLTIP